MAEVTDDGVATLARRRIFLKAAAQDLLGTWLQRPVDSSGLTVRDAGALLGLSYQRVGQLVDRR